MDPTAPEHMLPNQKAYAHPTHLVELRINLRRAAWTHPAELSSNKTNRIRTILCGASERRTAQPGRQTLEAPQRPQRPQRPLEGGLGRNREQHIDECHRGQHAVPMVVAASLGPRRTRARRTQPSPSRSQPMTLWRVAERATTGRRAPPAVPSSPPTSTGRASLRAPPPTCTTACAVRRVASGWPPRRRASFSASASQGASRSLA